MSHKSKCLFLITGYWFFVPFVLLGLVVPQAARMQEPFVQCGAVGQDPSLPTYGNFDPLTCTLEDLLAVPIRIYNYLLGIAAFVVLAVILISGLRMFWYWGAESPETELKNAKDMLTRGLLGFAIVAAAYLTVNVVLAILGLNRGSLVGVWLDRFGLLVPWDPLRY